MLHCPYAQRVYWAFTEGACAIALMFAGGSNALSALQAVSIVSGFPLTMAISYMCAALLRACKYDCMEDEIYLATRFRTGLFDSLEGFKPNVFAVRVDPVTGKRDRIAIKLPEVGERVQSLVISLFAPFVTVHDMNVQLWKVSYIYIHTHIHVHICMTICIYVQLRKVFHVQVHCHTRICRCAHAQASIARCMSLCVLCVYIYRERESEP